MEVVHAGRRRHRVRGGLGGRRAAGGGQDGAAPHRQDHGEPGRARAGGGQQAGPEELPDAGGDGAGPGAEGAGARHAVAPAARLRHHGGRPAGGHGEGPRDDPEAPQGPAAAAAAEEEEMISGVTWFGGRERQDFFKRKN